MEKEGINYKSLRKTQQTEKSSPVLTELQTGFYIELQEYLERLDKRFEKESASQKKTLLKEEIENTKKIAANVYELREKKILLAAISKARSGNPNLNNMSDIEKTLFDSILGFLLKTRGQVFVNKTTKEEDILETEKIEPEKESIVEEEHENKNHVLKITKDIPEFIGTDKKKYTLRKDDVLSMPENMSDMLIKKHVAERIKR